MQILPLFKHWGSLNTYSCLVAMVAGGFNVIDNLKGTHMGGSRLLGKI